ncbi:dihydroorotate dehydrogenase 1B [[Clostridium] sordellii]|uniref:Dihydroorotate dehydrogenase n=1 Tax=Paraclostridium sordellii TaxID=1505 RepID=A0ABM9RTI6_PARSO|nr:dihydroorotate dehydrogenase [Paeniclostridium sordellii]CEJ75166.1 Dihydroorotate dehydrogenase catalytic subunit [[Clostridium] sordellii] [Paeniclostridium sordellii]CEN70935.1 dihydroorotate dehydrogenase 1B [[Clostridium] sordellii] [Paeniclostridium sordellii]CEN74226.1 dihydroorotate dehydrogenase 1B [[Clostridium] sordellii] [Paeniclostridium sordellii]CEO30353.1 dihydroorotate dehydrogenase 1B [[Clostridium] sordellii] [Paeniclostridium sordellii]CEP65806.1 dihydroorotate dehydroge
MTNLNVKFGNIEFKNPLIMASGTFGFGKEYAEIYDIDKLGGISSKGLTLEKRDGNKGIRVFETPSGMMNSVGLENPGVKGFIENELQFFKDIDTVRIANLGGGTLDDYIKGVELLNDQPIDMIELNISCPNVKAGGMAFGIKNEVAREVVRAVRSKTKLPLIVKLSPNAEDIIGMAKVCEEEGADGISLVNTFKAMAIDINKKKPVFENVYAGLSGPAIKPIALRMVHEVCKAVNIPVMGMGGITTWQDAIEFIMAGATCIQVGTANFINPRIGIDIIEGIKNYMKEEGIDSLDEIRGII